MRVEIFDSPRALSEAAASFVARRAAGSTGRFSLALSGGTSPIKTYRLLGRPPLSERTPWPRVHLFWSDERCLPTSHPKSNAGAALKAFGLPPGLPEKNIHPIPADRGPERGAAAYEAELRAFFGSGAPPIFDIMLLGLGPDGHTASLFPQGPALEIMDRWAVGLPAPEHMEPRVARVTLTLPVLNAARTVLFLASGPSKAGAVSRILKPASGADKALPAARVRPNGDLVWFLDRDAAAELEKQP